MRLSDLHTGERAIILRHHTGKAFRKRLMEMGFIPGEEILVVKNAPLKDPVEYRILNYDVTLRRSEAAEIEVEPLKSVAQNHRQSVAQSHNFEAYAEETKGGNLVGGQKHIKVAFVGNPNSGKTSLFNAASGAHEHVGNYSGVTVEASKANYKQDGFIFELIDLPGAYSLSSYSPEEKYVSQYLMGDERPDVVINVVDSTNLERHLYMTSQLLEVGIPVVVALNMWDELEASQSVLNREQLSKLLGMPLCPTNGRTGKGLKALFNHVITIYQNRSEEHRVIDVRYRQEIEDVIAELSIVLNELKHELPENIQELRPRYVSIKLLEEDGTMLEAISQLPSEEVARIKKLTYELGERYQTLTGNELQHDITSGRYGFIRGALQETYHTNYDSITERNRKIDHILTHKIWGFPIFIAVIFLMFQLTFTLGEYPMGWIESGVAWLGEWIGEMMPEGMLKDLIVDGVIAGVGGVLVFLPNIVILYLCLAIIEDTGYMARAAFIMDKLMHLIGLHGKSFIPLVMGFGCNVPAVMATRTIENRNNRLVTMLIIPFMSCSAKLPVYLLLAGTFFPNHAGLVLFILYFTGILVAILSALLFKKRFNTAKETPFVMELPPYRIPTLKSVLLHMWERAKQYLQKMGSVILVASIAIWALSYFPNVQLLSEEKQDQLIAQHTSEANGKELTDFVQMERDHQLTMIQQEYSLVGRLGHAVQPVFQWHGYDWRMSVSLLTGVAAKEIVVSTMGVLFTGDGENEALLSQKLQNATHPDGTKVLDPVIAFSFMIFVLVYIPCISTVIAIGRESGRWKYALFSTVYSIVTGWVLALLVTQIGHLLF